MLKETVIVISSDPPCKNVQFKVVPLKAIFDQRRFKYKFFCFCVYFLCWISAKVTCAFLDYKKWRRNYPNKTFSESKKRYIFFHILDFTGTVGNRAFSTLSWRVSYNYAYSPFNKSFIHFINHSFIVFKKKY